MKQLFVLLCLTGLVLLPSAKAQMPELKEVPATLTIYVPGNGAKLRQREVKGKLYNFMPTAPCTYASVVAEKSLPLLFQKSRSSFPQGTKLTRFPEIKDDVMQVSLSKQFAKRGFWNNRERPLLAVYAVVNTAVEGYPTPNYPVRVRLLIDGKPLRNLAHIDLRKPLSPRLDMVANGKGSSRE